MNKLEKIFWTQWEKDKTKILSFKELIVSTKWDSKRLSLYLKRLLKAKRINRIAKGYYTLPFIEWKWGELLRKIQKPCYLTGLWVLARNEIYLKKIDDIEGRICSQNKKVWSKRGDILFYRDSYFNLEGVHEDELIATSEKAFVDHIENEWRVRQNIRINKKKWHIKNFLKLDFDKVKKYGKSKKRKINEYIDNAVGKIKNMKKKLNNDELIEKFEIVLKKEERRKKNV